jgi:hypothetical protein
VNQGYKRRYFQHVANYHGLSHFMVREGPVKRQIEKDRTAIFMKEFFIPLKNVEPMASASRSQIRKRS